MRILRPLHTYIRDVSLEPWTEDAGRDRTGLDWMRTRCCTLWSDTDGESWLVPAPRANGRWEITRHRETALLLLLLLAGWGT